MQYNLNEYIELRNWKIDSHIVPLVSIDCLTYNHSKYIRDAIEGFLMQKTNFPVEILIHDDASTDGTTEIIKECEKQFWKDMLILKRMIKNYQMSQ